MIGAALIGEDGVRDLTTAVDIGSKSWPFDIRLRLWVFRPLNGLLYITGDDVRGHFLVRWLQQGPAPVLPPS